MIGSYYLKRIVIDLNFYAFTYCKKNWCDKKSCVLKGIFKAITKPPNSSDVGVVVMTVTMSENGPMVMPEAEEVSGPWRATR